MVAAITPATVITPSPPGITSSSSSGSAANTGSGVVPVEVSLNGAPDKIQQLARQIQVGGLISALPDDGQITVNTVLGNLTIILPQLAQDQQQKLEQQLLDLFQSQKPLTIVVQPSDPPTQAFLLLPPEPGGTPTGSAVLPPTSGVVVQAAAPPLLVPGASLPAVVLLPTDATSAIPLDEQLALKAQSVADQTIIQQPEQILSGSPALPLAGPSQGVAPPLSAQAAAPASLPSLLQPGMELNLTVNSIAPPSSSPPVAILPNQIVATVIGGGPGGQVLMKAGDATLYVQQPTNVPVGSSVLLTVDPARVPAPVHLPLPDAGNFGALQQALATLSQTDPALARQLMESIIPQPTPALTGALFLLFAAFQQGNLGSWLGPNATDILNKSGRIELIARLTQALSEGGQEVRDPVVGTWRSYPLPFYANGQFQVLDFYVHGDRNWRGQGGPKDDAKAGIKSVRFLIDMRLSKLGAIQLDGFVRQKQLDMVIRSEADLPPGLDRDLRQTYVNALSAIDYAGTLAFQTGKQNWLFIRKPTAAGNVVT